MAVLTQARAQALIDEQGSNIVIPDFYTKIDDYAFLGGQTSDWQVLG